MSSVEDLIRRALGLDRDEGLRPVWKLLEEGGADPYAVDWIRRYDKDIVGAWSQCPRADWLVAVAVHLGVDRDRTFDAVEACLDEAARALGPGSKTAAEALAIARKWHVGRASLERLVSVIWRCIEEATEAAPGYHQATTLARRYRVVGPFDDAYHMAQQRLADRIRERLPLELVESAYLGRESGPYR